MEGVPDAALEDIAYLSRSDNRVSVLKALSEDPHTRRELEEATGVSRATLGRIVNEFEERNWAERTTDGDYAATATGEHIITQFTPFAESIQAIRRLGEAIEWLPTDELSIGLHHFSDASVRRPEFDDPVEGIEYMGELTRAASEFRTLTHLTAPKALLETMRDRVVSGRLTLEVVTPTEFVVWPTDQSGRQELWRDIIEADADLYLCDGPIPCNLWVIDKTVLIKKSRPGPIDEAYGAPIVCSDSTVRSWAHDLIDQYRVDATRIDLEMLA